MKFKIGSNFHPVNEASLAAMTIREVKSKRGKRTFLHYQLHIRGEVQAADEVSLDTPIQELINRYAANYQDVGLCHDDETPTPHFISNSDPKNASGNHITYRSWPKDTDGEYANARTFAILAEALMDEGESGLWEYQETLTFVGNCGALWDAHVPRVGVCREYQVSEFSVQHIIQRGYAVTADAYYLPPSPVFPTLKNYRPPILEETSPNLYGQLYYGYKTAWAYFKQSVTDLSGSGSPTLV